MGRGLRGWRGGEVLLRQSFTLGMRNIVRHVIAFVCDSDIMHLLFVVVLVVK